MKRIETNQVHPKAAAEAVAAGKALAHHIGREFSPRLGVRPCIADTALTQEATIEHHGNLQHLWTGTARRASHPHAVGADRLYRDPTEVGGHVGCQI